MESGQQHHPNKVDYLRQTERSPHASISFTAHYTGQMWQKLGWSHPALATAKGRWLHRLVAPVEWLVTKIFHTSMGHTLMVRHQLIDDRITAFLQTYPNAQLVEIAAGLSPRGWRFLQQYPDLTYVEVDLPNMAAQKKQRLAQIEGKTPKVLAVDLLQDDLTPIFSKFDVHKPVLVIAEGLINYFSLPVLAQLSQRLAEQLKPFTVGTWITENYPLADHAKIAWLINQSSRSLRLLSRSQFSFYFDKPKPAIHFFNQQGFSQVDVWQPSQFQQVNNSQHLGDLVWVLQMQV